jgi:aspartyl-tRNA(Asn)/glutamyl-tRNA(Gln) amidotransferase subunit B
MTPDLPPEDRASVQIEHARLIVGLEIHVELATRTKMFSRAPNPAYSGGGRHSAEPNTLVDPVVLALPGSLPVMNKRAVEMSMMVGVALGCEIARESVWDRKSYFYPDLPKAYQISQYELPLCFDGSVDVPRCDEKGLPDPELGERRVRVIRAHLEEDAGKLLHEGPGGVPIPGTNVDLNRAGTPLLEIVTAPDFDSADDVVAFCRYVRRVCRFLGVSDCVMQQGQIRFEPNINMVLTLAGGRTVTTPIVEIKNLNSFRSVREAIEYESRTQADRWREDGREMGAGMKSTRGWNEGRGETTPQREKEDAHDYRYFPDPDLPRVVVDDAWLAEVRSAVAELPTARMARYVDTFGLTRQEAATLTDEREDCVFFESAVVAAVARGVPNEQAGRLCANLMLQTGLKRLNELASAQSDDHDGDDTSDETRDETADVPTLVSGLGISAQHVGHIAAMRASDAISASNAEALFGILCREGYAERDAEAVAEYEGLLTVRDEEAVKRWVTEVIAENESIAEQIRGGKVQAAGRLIGEVMKRSKGSADPKHVRAVLLEQLGVEG